MRISAKGRYALASAIVMAENYGNGEYITVISISERLGISKIYLEQIFSLLKRGGIVSSVKGAQGGYQLTRMPVQITALDVLSAVESPMFEQVEDTVRGRAPEIEAAMRVSVFDAVDGALRGVLRQVTLRDLMDEVEKRKSEHGFMFYI